MCGFAGSRAPVLCSSATSHGPACPVISTCLPCRHSACLPCHLSACLPPLCLPTLPPLCLPALPPLCLPCHHFATTSLPPLCLPCHHFATTSLPPLCLTCHHFATTSLARLCLALASSPPACHYLPSATSQQIEQCVRLDQGRMELRWGCQGIVPTPALPGAQTQLNV